MPFIAQFTSHTTSSPLPSPLTHNSLSLHHLYIQGGHLQYLPAFLILLLLKSNDKWWRHHQHCNHRSSHTNSHCSQTHSTTGHCTCKFIVAISNPCAEAWGLQNPRIRFITTKTLCILGEMPICK